MWLRVVCLVVALAASFDAARPAAKVDIEDCKEKSCYPATGNLLIGREANLTATSTCGLKGPQRYCIVSHLEAKNTRQCFWCDSRPGTERKPDVNHRISNIVYKTYPGTPYKSWWQSENGKESVSIQLNLEAEFHFTHLMIEFKTFRPAAMLVERSTDFGDTWQVYRYFAHNCAESFPGFPLAPPKNLSQVVCESRYSNVAPSSGGEVVFQVLPSSNTYNITNPYSLEIQNLLRITNLRVNFTKLHTLGDDLLDHRPEILEKYYYAVTSMIVRGSCSCYGHASRCLPLPGIESRVGMVHGKCECHHHTAGLNCEYCEDLYNDWPWQPATGKRWHECKLCNCNDHASSCHFDEAVFNHTGQKSGGVCDECQHNTMGRNCEQCKYFYYRDPTLDLSHPDICKPCDCDPVGSIDEGLCDRFTDKSEGLDAGKCHCKTNVGGVRCDVCKEGFWNFKERNPDGCDVCSCNPLGTVERGCDQGTGECTCKRHVTGVNCDQCLPNYFDLSAENEYGCSFCDCDPGGSLDTTCDVINGQCRCRQSVTGRRCDVPAQDHFSVALDFFTYEAELGQCDSRDDINSISSQLCQVVTREQFNDPRKDTWTGTGFMKVFEDDSLQFVIDNLETSMDYKLVIRYEPKTPGDWEVLSVFINRTSPVDLNGPCANSAPQEQMVFTLPYDQRSVVSQSSTCLEAHKRYDVKVYFGRQNSQNSNPRATILIDSLVLIPDYKSIPFYAENLADNRMRNEEFVYNNCGDPYYYSVQKPEIPEVCKKHHVDIGFYVYNGAKPCRCDPTGSMSNLCEEYGGQCICKQNVVGQQCNRCKPGTYGFGPDGCKSCDCNGIGSLDNFCDVNSGQCKCRPNTYGRKCDECQPGFWNFPNCEQCECNGHADFCDPRTGACIDCRNFTEGHRCERCVASFYGDPRIGSDIACRPCPCPGSRDSGHSFANHCYLSENDVVCACNYGYAGSRCEICADNYFGHPENPGGSCEPCECSGNVDKSKPGNCDPHTGKCLQCLDNTGGDHCEICKPGFFGNSLDKTCQKCECHALGTDPNIKYCDHVTGQCPCLPNVIGKNCDECAPNHWKIASGHGCDPCDCDPIGSYSDQCHIYFGNCTCKEEFGGRQCDQCQENYWGNPRIECFPCDCDYYGSESQQCMRENGSCICRKGMGGEKCNMCARGYLGNAPRCEACGECFNNWDLIIDDLKEKTRSAITNASQIKIVGATGAYTRDFDEMNSKIKDIELLLNNTSLGENEINFLQGNIEHVKSSMKFSEQGVDEANNGLTKVISSINLAKVSLDGLRLDIEKLMNKTKELNQNAMKLQESNLEGALNLTREAKQRALKAEQDTNDILRTVDETDRQIRGTDLLIERQYSSFNASLSEADNTLDNLLGQLNELENAIPGLNEQMCGQDTATCDVCGGASCGKCGGISCEKGAVTKAEQALDFANKTENLIKELELTADDLLRSVTQATLDTASARSKSDEAFNAAVDLKNRVETVVNESQLINSELKQFLQNNSVPPVDIRALSDDILSITINLKPEEINQLSQDINATVSTLTNIQNIIDETKPNVDLANNLKERALSSKQSCDLSLATASKVAEALNQAEIAQNEAEQAISKAKSDIEAATNDLAPIALQTNDAEKQANSTKDEVEILRLRLGNLQRNVVKVENDAQQVNNEANDVVKIAEDAEQEARELRQTFKTANATLTGRIDKTSNSRERAQLLLTRATTLAGETQRQLNELQNMEDLYNNHADQLNEINIKIDDLNNKMAHYLEEISRRADGFLKCKN